MDESLVLVKKPKRYYSPLRYPGGKAILADFLFTVIERNKITDATYVEPFAGGAGAALTLLFLEKVDNIIVNDLDPAIYSFWKAILSDTERFVSKIEVIEITVEEWQKQKALYLSSQSTEFERGFATFFLNRTNHSGIIGGRPIGGLEQTGKWKIDARFNRQNLSNRIQKIASYKNRIKVCNLDGIKLMEQMIKLESILFYIDPPYYEQGSSLYLNHYNPLDHTLLANFLNTHADKKWLLTYDNVPEISELYQRRHKTEFGLYYHTNKPKKCKELLIKSDQLLI